MFKKTTTKASFWTKLPTIRTIIFSYPFWVTVLWKAEVGGILAQYFYVLVKTRLSFPSKHFLFSETLVEDFISVTIFHLPTASSKRVCKTSSRRPLGRQKNVTVKTSSRHLQHAFTNTNLSWVVSFNPLMHNVPKWSNTLLKSCSKWYKISKVCLTILQHYALKG